MCVCVPFYIHIEHVYVYLIIHTHVIYVCVPFNIYTRFVCMYAFTIYMCSMCMCTIYRCDMCMCTHANV